MSTRMDGMHQPEHESLGSLDHASIETFRNQVGNDGGEELNQIIVDKARR